MLFDVAALDTTAAVSTAAVATEAGATDGAKAVVACGASATAADPSFE